MHSIRSNLKNVFSPNLCVGFSFQVLDILMVCLRVETKTRLDLKPESYF
jgi:hypothetical protein